MTDFLDNLRFGYGDGEGFEADDEYGAEGADLSALEGPSDEDLWAIEAEAERFETPY